jgi:hypothetical protein
MSYDVDDIKGHTIRHSWTGHYGRVSLYTLPLKLVGRWTLKLEKLLTCSFWGLGYLVLVWWFG